MEFLTIKYNGESPEEILQMIGDRDYTLNDVISELQKTKIGDELDIPFPTEEAIKKYSPKPKQKYYGEEIQKNDIYANDIMPSLSEYSQEKPERVRKATEDKGFMGASIDNRVMKEKGAPLDEQVIQAVSLFNQMPKNMWQRETLDREAKKYSYSEKTGKGIYDELSEDGKRKLQSELDSGQYKTTKQIEELYKKRLKEEQDENWKKLEEMSPEDNRALMEYADENWNTLSGKQFKNKKERIIFSKKEEKRKQYLDYLDRRQREKDEKVSENVTEDDILKEAKRLAWNDKNRLKLLSSGASGAPGAIGAIGKLGSISLAAYNLLNKKKVGYENPTDKEITAKIEEARKNLIRGLNDTEYSRPGRDSIYGTDTKLPSQVPVYRGKTTGKDILYLNSPALEKVKLPIVGNADKLLNDTTFVRTVVPAAMDVVDPVLDVGLGAIGLVGKGLAAAKIIDKTTKPLRTLAQIERTKGGVLANTAADGVGMIGKMQGSELDDQVKNLPKTVKQYMRDKGITAAQFDDAAKRDMLEQAIKRINGEVPAANKVEGVIDAVRRNLDYDTIEKKAGGIINKSIKNNEGKGAAFVDGVGLLVPDWRIDSAIERRVIPGKETEYITVNNSVDPVLNPNYKPPEVKAKEDLLIKNILQTARREKDDTMTSIVERIKSHVKGTELENVDKLKPERKALYSTIWQQFYPIDNMGRVDKTQISPKAQQLMQQLGQKERIALEKLIYEMDLMTWQHEGMGLIAKDDLLENYNKKIRLKDKKFSILGGKRQPKFVRNVDTRREYVGNIDETERLLGLQEAASKLDESDLFYKMGNLLSRVKDARAIDPRYAQANVPVSELSQKIPAEIKTDPRLSKKFGQEMYDEFNAGRYTGSDYVEGKKGALYVKPVGKKGSELYIKEKIQKLADDPSMAGKTYAQIAEELDIRTGYPRADIYEKDVVFPAAQAMQKMREKQMILEAVNKLAEIPDNGLVVKIPKNAGNAEREAANKIIEANGLKPLGGAADSNDKIILGGELNTKPIEYKIQIQSPENVPSDLIDRNIVGYDYYVKPEVIDYLKGEPRAINDNIRGNIEKGAQKLTGWWKSGVLKVPGLPYLEGNLSTAMLQNLESADNNVLRLAAAQGKIMSDNFNVRGTTYNKNDVWERIKKLGGADSVNSEIIQVNKEGRKEFYKKGKGSPVYSANEMIEKNARLTGVILEMEKGLPLDAAINQMIKRQYDYTAVSPLVKRMGVKNVMPFATYAANSLKQVATSPKSIRQGAMYSRLMKGQSRERESWGGEDELEGTRRNYDPYEMWINKNNVFSGGRFAPQNTFYNAISDRKSMLAGLLSPTMQIIPKIANMDLSARLYDPYAGSIKPYSEGGRKILGKDTVEIDKGDEQLGRAINASADVVPYLQPISGMYYNLPNKLAPDLISSLETVVKGKPSFIPQGEKYGDKEKSIGESIRNIALPKAKEVNRFFNNSALSKRYDADYQRRSKLISTYINNRIPKNDKERSDFYTSTDFNKSTKKEIPFRQILSDRLEMADDTEKFANNMIQELAEMAMSSIRMQEANSDTYQYYKEKNNKLLIEDAPRSERMRNKNTMNMLYKKIRATYDNYTEAQERFKELHRAMTQLNIPVNYEAIDKITGRIKDGE